MNRRLQNSAVILTAIAAALAVIETQTQGFRDGTALSGRERCYGVARQAANDCATARHSCAAQAKKDGDRNEWIMVPRGVCDKLIGGVTEAL